MLTDHQKEVMDNLLPELVRDAKIVLQGSAGVGKTYMVDSLITHYKLKKYLYGPVYVTAPTHKALSVLRTKVTPREYLEFRTIHSLLNMRRQINNETGETFFAQDKSVPCDLTRASLLIVDEVSMLSEDILKILDQYNVPMVFVGDNKQLNPVGEEDSPAFVKRFKTLELTEIIRQGEGNPIIDLSRSIDDIWKREEKIVQNGDDFYGYIYTKDRNKIINRLAEVNGTDELKYLAWTNADVDQMNKDVRHRIYGENPKKVEVGESIVFKNPYGEYHTNDEVKVVTCDLIHDKMLVPNGEKVGGMPDFDKVDVRVYMVNKDVPILHEQDMKKFSQAKTRIKKLAIIKKIPWKLFYEFAEQYADFTYNHAITVHKSQGSTYQKAIIHVKDMNRNKKKKEKKRLFYTAITRASDLVILFNT